VINIDRNNIHVAYSVQLLQDFKTFPERSVFVSSIKMNKYFIPALFVYCLSKDISYFGIKIPPPEPGLKFRYYDFGVNIPVAVVEKYLSHPFYRLCGFHRVAHPAGKRGKEYPEKLYFECYFICLVGKQRQGKGMCRAANGCSYCAV